MSAIRRDRADVWLPLLRRLTAVSPTWVVWKNADAALEGSGDIDAAAAATDASLIEREFRQWATRSSLTPMIVCPHIPGGLNLVAAPEGMTSFLEVGVKNRRIFRGATLFSIEDLAPLAVMDPRGFRRIRLGAEGFFKLLLNGSSWSGKANWDALRDKGVAEQLRADPEGVTLAARLLGPAAPAALILARNVEAGTWSRTAALVVEAFMLLRALGDPAMLVRRILFRLRGKTRCAIVKAILEQERRVPSDRERWLRQVATNHRIEHGAEPVSARGTVTA